METQLNSEEESLLFKLYDHLLTENERVRLNELASLNSDLQSQIEDFLIVDAASDAMLRNNIKMNTKKFSTNRNRQKIFLWGAIGLVSLVVCSFFYRNIFYKTTKEELQQIAQIALFEKPPYHNVITAKSINSNVYLDEGMDYYVNGDFKSASNSIRSYINENPTSELAKFYLAICYQKLNDINEAMKLYQEIPYVVEQENLQNYETSIIKEAKFNYLNCLIYLNNLEEALDFSKSVPEKYKNNEFQKVQNQLANFVE